MGTQLKADTSNVKSPYERQLIEEYHVALHTHLKGKRFSSDKRKWQCILQHAKSHDRKNMTSMVSVLTGTESNKEVL